MPFRSKKPCDRRTIYRLSALLSSFLITTLTIYGINQLQPVPAAQHHASVPDAPKPTPTFPDLCTPTSLLPLGSFLCPIARIAAVTASKTIYSITTLD